LQAGFLAYWLGSPISSGIGAALSLLYGIFTSIRYPEVSSYNPTQENVVKYNLAIGLVIFINPCLPGMIFIN
jgi:hypothetical protein